MVTPSGADVPLNLPQIFVNGAKVHVPPDVMVTPSIDVTLPCLAQT